MNTVPNVGNVLDTPLSEALSERYLAYALSTIVSRSLPDVRDGLKPVHRRLLYAMRLLKLNPETGFKKCARVVGDVIGDLNSRRGRITGAVPKVESQIVGAEVPMAEVLDYGNVLGALTSGRGLYTMQIKTYQPVPTHIARIVVQES